jgi:hypothetical protein
MEFGMKRIITLICVMSLLSLNNIHAACLGKSPIWGTADTRESCIEKQELKAEEERLKIERKKQSLENERLRLRNNNSGLGSGTGNNNIILSGLEELIAGKRSNKNNIDIVISKHQLRIELAAYVIPGAYQFDQPGTPERLFINGLAWEYYVNRNLGFGLLLQEWSKKGGRSFDPIKTTQYDESGDAFQSTKYFPGLIESISYRSIIPYVSINARLGSPLWVAIGRVGIGPTYAAVKYKSVNKTANPYAEQPGDKTYTDGASLMFDLAIERWTLGGTRMGMFIRYINSRNDTSNYLEYLNMSSAQIGFHVQFMLKPLGIL